MLDVVTPSHGSAASASPTRESDVETDPFLPPTYTARSGEWEDTDPKKTPHEALGTTNPFNPNPLIESPGTQSRGSSTILLGHPATGWVQPVVSNNSQSTLDIEGYPFDDAAQALEHAASLHPDARMRRSLTRKAEKLRQRQAKQARVANGGCSTPATLKTMGGTFILLLTSPFYLGGIIIEATGSVLEVAGTAVKAMGKGFRKVHTWTADKLDL